MTEVSNIPKTKNGMVTNTTSLNECVNLFFTIGAMRGKEKSKIVSIFKDAFNEDPRTAMRILFWSRDIREGAGERQIFKDVIHFLSKNHPEVVKVNLDLIPEYGRWDDLHVLFGTELEGQCVSLIVKGLKDANALTAKWTPRKGIVFNKVRKELRLIPKELRKLLVSLSKTVEQKMCSDDWSNIEYSKIPSLAMSRYMKAFGKNDYNRFTEYIESLKKGETKVNVGAIYPYDVIKSLKFGNGSLANEQWKSLPDWVSGSKEYVLPMVDVSGSMNCSVGGNKNLLCLDVAVSLGMYISERNEGPFKDMFMTFSTHPKIEKLLGNLSERYEQLNDADWNMSTDLERAFKTILEQAVKFNVPKDQMPTMMLILSDMEFDSASEWNLSSQKMIDKLYEENGYNTPKIVYWNLNSDGGNFPVTQNEIGVSLVSGFSPSIMKTLLSDFDEFTPYNIMDKAINCDRYELIKI